MYECYRNSSHGYKCHVLVNGREYQTDNAYESDTLAQENAAMRAFMICRNFSVNSGMLARNGIVQGLPAPESSSSRSRSRKSGSGSSSSGGSSSGPSSRSGGKHSRRSRSGDHSSGSGSSTPTYD